MITMVIWVITFPGYAEDASNPDFITTPEGWFPVAYNRESDGVVNFQHPFYNETSLIPETELFTIYGEGEYQLTDSTTALYRGITESSYNQTGRLSSVLVLHLQRNLLRR